MLYRISVTERGLTGIANIFRSRLSRLDDLLGAGTVPLSTAKQGHRFAIFFFFFTSRGLSRRGIRRDRVGRWVGTAHRTDRGT